MASSAQITANQANAQHSTGPRTPEGRARVSQNRITHGLTSGNVLLPGEDPAAYDALLGSLVVGHVPATATERALVESIAHNQWRLERIARWEAALLAESLEGDPAQPSRLMTTFSKAADSSEALAKLQRYEASTRRAWLAALKELRLQKSARHRANTVEASTTTNDRKQMVAVARAVAAENGLPFPAASENDDSNPIPSPGLPVEAAATAAEPVVEASH
jgi:hypothetical protein